jgi:hypothetical protein
MIVERFVLLPPPPGAACTADAGEEVRGLVLQPAVADGLGLLILA